MTTSTIEVPVAAESEVFQSGTSPDEITIGSNATARAGLVRARCALQQQGATLASGAKVDSFSRTAQWVFEQILANA
jgi:hypothetical protein